MRLFDTHCHFETCDAAEIAPILARAAEAGVAKLTAVGGSVTLDAGAVAARAVATQLRAEGRPAPEVLVATGRDRDQVVLPVSPVVPVVARAAVGEIGLDYHYSPETRRDQLALFAAQLEEARAADLPVIVHTREAADDTIGLLREIPARGIIHSFTGTREEAKAYLDLGFYVSLSGIVTFRAADNVREMSRVIPDDRLLIETDAPFLAPVPMRGKTNEPAYVRHTCAFLAALRGREAETIAERTSENAETVFQRRENR